MRFVIQNGSRIFLRAASILLVVSVTCLPETAAAQPGQLDPSFGNGGKVATSFLNQDRAAAVAVQPDGKIVVVGRTANASDPTSGDFAVARYGVNGALDSSFGAGGKVTTDFLGFDDGATAVAIQADGKIVVAGFASVEATVPDQLTKQLALARYDGAGSLDSTFGSAGKVMLDRILVQLRGGLSGACGGTSPTPVPVRSASGLVIQPDGKYVVSVNTFSYVWGDFLGTARFGPSGSLDTTFAGPNAIWPDCAPTQGVVLTRYFDTPAAGIALQSDGRILVMGNLNGNEQVVLVRLLQSGAPDTSFGSGGVATYSPSTATERGAAIALQADGKIVIAGSAFPATSGQNYEMLELKRYQADGALDPSFGSGGTVLTVAFHWSLTAEGVAIDATGNIIVAGCLDTIGPEFSHCPDDVTTSSLLFARYKPDGTRDSTFGANGFTTTNFSGFRDGGYGVALQPDGRIVAAGFTTADAAGQEKFAVVRVLGGSVSRALVADFGSPFGLWILRGSTWTSVHGLSPVAMVAGDLDGNRLDDLVVNFGPGVGVWAWMNHSTWTFIHGASPSLMVTGDLDGNGHDDIVFDFPGYGLWRWSDGSWSNLHGLDATRIAVGNLDGTGKAALVVDFPGYGLYEFINNSIWIKLHTFHANALLMADLDADGYDDIVVDFGPPYGIWVLRSYKGWTPLHGLSPTHMAAGNIDGTAGADLVIDFGPPYGLWTFRNNTTWVPLHALSADSIVLGDRDNSGKDEIIIDFGPAYGLYEYSNDSTWNRLHSQSPQSMVTGRFY